MEEILVGKVTHYFSRIAVAVLDLQSSLTDGDEFHIVGPLTELGGSVESMEIHHRQVGRAFPGDDVALKVNGQVREGDQVYIRVKSVLIAGSVN